MITTSSNQHAVATPQDALSDITQQLKGKTPNYLNCRLCKSRFLGYYTPMEMSKLAKIMKNAHCPMCGANANKLTLCFDKNEPINA